MKVDSSLRTLAAGSLRVSTRAWKTHAQHCGLRDLA
jgi:hypothetical protein